FRNHLLGHHKISDLFEPLQEGFVDLLMTVGEFSGYVFQKRTDLIFRKGHDPGDNSARSLGILVSERTEKNSGLVRAKDRGRALDAYRGSGDHGLVNLEKRARKPAIIFNANLLPSPARDTPESFGCSFEPTRRVQRRE